jgi:hypothetical protein
MTLSQLMATLENFEKKYCLLVWYASKERDDTAYYDLPKDQRAAILSAIARVESAYPTETADLNDMDKGDWEHGFNSGMLACGRYLYTAIKFSMEQADDEFPMLDS